MSSEKPREWPLLPSDAASVVHELSLVLADVVEEVSEAPGRRGYLKLHGLATAIELFAREAARWYGSLAPGEQEALNALEAAYAAARKLR